MRIMINKKKQFKLPLKKAAKESTNPPDGVDLVVLSGGGPVSRTKLRSDFEAQAQQLKEKIAIGFTPVKADKPKNKLSLKADGTLKGEVETLKPQDGKEERPDLTEAAKTVYEGTKRPVFVRKSTSTAEESLNLSMEDDITRVSNSPGHEEFHVRLSDDRTDIVGSRTEAERLWKLHCADPVKGSATECKAGKLKAAMSKIKKSTSAAEESISSAEGKNRLLNDGFIKLTDGRGYYVLARLNKENFPEMPATLEKQLKDEDKYGTYVTFFSILEKPPYRLEMLPIYGDPERYVTKWLYRDPEEAVKQAARSTFRTSGLLRVSATESGAHLSEGFEILSLANQLGLKSIEDLSTITGDRRNVPPAEIIRILKKKIAEKQGSATECKAGKLKAAMSKIKKSTPIAPTKDETESTDPQPKEAVAFEAGKYNRRERVWLRNNDTKGITTAMNSGELARARGNYLLSRLKTSAIEEIDIPKASDKGKAIEKDDVIPATENKSAKRRPLSDIPANVVDTAEDYGIVSTTAAGEEFNSLVAQIDTEIGDELDVEVSYESEKPVKGKIVFDPFATTELQQKAKGALEGMGLSVRHIAVKESTILHFTAKEDITSKDWWALVATSPDKTKISQVSLSSENPATESATLAHLEKQYGKDSVYQLSSKPINE